MELSVREWLILIGVLLIVVVLVDAFRRYRQERRSTIRIAKTSFGAGGGFDNEGPELYSSELPGGGARVRPRKAADVGDDRVEPSIGEPEPDAARDPLAPSEAIAPAASAGAPPSAVGSSQDAGQEVLVLNVISRDDGGFRGPDLLQILLACDVRFGDMDIFHRYEQGHGQGAKQFSVANAVEPGTFDLDNIDAFHTPGISLFMQLPGPKDPMAAFDCMIETAKCIVKNLNGEMLDESLSAMTAQTLEHSRAPLLP